MSTADAFEAHQRAFFDALDADRVKVAAESAATIDRLTQDVADANAAATELEQRYAAEQGAHAETRAAFDAYKASHPDKPGMLVGAAVTVRAGETLTTAFERFEKACGPVQIGRAYDNGKGPAKMLADARAEGLGKRAICGSFKAIGNDMVGFAAGNQDAALKAALVAISAERGDLPFYIAPFHEPEPKVNVKTYTAAQWRAAFAHAADVIKAHGDPGIHVTMILTGYDFAARIGTYDIPGKIDVYGIDPYSHKGSDGAEQLVKMYGAFQWFVANGKRWAVTETGQASTVPADHAALVKSLPWLAANGCEFLTYFSVVVKDGAGAVMADFQVDQNPEAAAAFRAIPRG